MSSPCQIRPDLILAAITANHVLYEDEACPSFVVKNIAFWWSKYLREKDLNLYDQGLATAAQLAASKTFKPRKLVQASASACQRDAAKDKKPPSHLRGKQIAEWKARNDPDSLEAKLAPKGSAASTVTFKVPPPPPPDPIPLPTTQPSPPPPPSPEPMDVDQEAVTASSAAATADSSKVEEKVEESELSDKEKADDKMEESELSDKEKEKEKPEDSDSEVSSIGDDIPAEAEDQDSAEEADVAQRLVKHRSVNAGQEKVLCQDETGETVTLTAGEAATAKPASEVSEEGGESEELIEDDPTMDPLSGRVWKGKRVPPEPASPPRERKSKTKSLLRESQRPTTDVQKRTLRVPSVTTSQTSTAGSVVTLPAVCVEISTSRSTADVMHLTLAEWMLTASLSA